MEENSNAQEQGAIEVGLNDAAIKNDQINTEACINSLAHPQPQVEQKSVHSKCTPEANSTETTCSSSQLQSSVKKQTRKMTILLPGTKDEKPKLVIAKDELCAEVSSMGELWKAGRQSQEDIMSSWIWDLHLQQSSSTKRHVTLSHSSRSTDSDSQEDTKKKTLEN